MNPFQAFAFGSDGRAKPAAKAAAVPPSSSSTPPSAAEPPQQSSPSQPRQQQRQPDSARTPVRRQGLRRRASPPPSQQPGGAAAATNNTNNKRHRKAYMAALTGPAKGLAPKLGPGQPLRLILVGHNPSEHAWHTGHYYSNPSNRMWPILIDTGIAPPGATGPEADDGMPTQVGVGFTDVGSGQPGTDSSLFSASDFAGWQSGFFERLQQHMKAASDSIGCTCGSCGAPALVAFAGKRQFMELLNLDASGQQLRGASKVAPASVQLGRQPPDRLPPGWPLPPDRTEVWVLTSTSGAAPMRNEDRQRPYTALAERLAQLPWPRTADNVGATCSLQQRVGGDY